MNYQAIKAANRTINNQECLAGARRLKSKPLFFWFDLKDRKSTRLNSSHSQISYAVFCLKKKNNKPSSPCPASANCLRGVIGAVALARFAAFSVLGLASSCVASIGRAVSTLDPPPHARVV